MGPEMRGFVASAELPQSLSIAPADSAYLEPTARSGCVAVGDAAMAFDPLASRGLHNALLSARNAVRGNSIGLSTTFQSYLEQKRECYLEERRFIDQPFWRRRQ